MPKTPLVWPHLFCGQVPKADRTLVQLPNHHNQWTVVDGNRSKVTYLVERTSLNEVYMGTHLNQVNGGANGKSRSCIAGRVSIK